MKDRIQQNYGIDVETNEYNAHITRTWDTVQEWVSVACLCTIVFVLVFFMWRLCFSISES